MGASGIRSQKIFYALTLIVLFAVNVLRSCITNSPDPLAGATAQIISSHSVGLVIRRYITRPFVEIRSMPTNDRNTGFHSLRGRGVAIAPADHARARGGSLMHLQSKLEAGEGCQK